MNRDNEYTHWNNEDDLDDLVGKWHDLESDIWDSLGQPDIAQYLGLTTDEYFRWCMEPGWIDKKLAEE